MEKQQLIDEINRLRKEKNAVIMAHYYQESDIQDIWYEKRWGKVLGIVLRYHTTLIVYSKDLDMDFSPIESIVNSMNIEVISGKATVMDKLYPYLEGSYTRKDTKLSQHIDVNLLQDIYAKIELAKPEDAMEIAICYGKIDEFRQLYSSNVDIRYTQIYNRIISGEGKHVFIKDDSGILSHGNTTAENRYSGMIGGILTREDMRYKGYGSQMVSYLTKDLLNKKKEVALFYDDEKTGEFFTKLGFKNIACWTVLRREKNE